MEKKISDIFTTLCGLMLLYLLACIVNVNQHNLTDLNYAEWNIIAHTFQVEEAEPEIITTTENVSMVNDSPKVDVAESPAPICIYTEDEIYRLAQLIQAENGSAEDDECLYLTGIVVMKRVKSDAYPDTIHEVIADEGQYATYIEGTIDCEPSERCLRIAREILVHGLERNYPDNLIYQAEFKQGKKVYKKIGHEYFCLAWKGANMEEKIEPKVVITKEEYAEFIKDSVKLEQIVRLVKNDDSNYGIVEDVRNILMIDSPKK